MIEENKVKFITITPNAENNIMYTARVSNPKNQNSNNTKLLFYCIKHKHWSIFEQAFMTVEITTSSSIAMQILRHRSMNFQQFSQRYQEVSDFITYQPRRQDEKNRQNSINDLDTKTKEWFLEAQKEIQKKCEKLYREALDKKIAKECARFLLPNSTKTVLYMSGSIRSFIHYLQVRLDNTTQKEHRDIAKKIQTIFIQQCPNISEALKWR